MLFKPTNYILTILFFLIIIGCSDNQTVKLIDTNFEDEIQSGQNLSFVFSKPLVGDSVLNRWDSTQYIRFEPKVPGVFKWSSESMLIFSPQAPFAPATSYLLTLTEKLTEKADLKLEDDRTLNLSTPQVEVLSVNTFWSSAREGQTLIHLDATFNHQVNTNEVLNKIEIKVNGTIQKAALAGNSDSKKVSLFLPDIAVADESFEIELSIAAGLLPNTGGNLPTSTNITRIFYTLHATNIIIIRTKAILIIIEILMSKGMLYGIKKWPVRIYQKKEE